MDTQVFEITPELLDRGYAETMPEWWGLLKHHWEAIARLAHSFGSSDVVNSMDIHWAKNDALGMYRVLHMLWDRLPDSPVIHEFEGFGPLCDLCSDFPYRRDG